MNILIWNLNFFFLNLNNSSLYFKFFRLRVGNFFIDKGYKEGFI